MGGGPCLFKVVRRVADDGIGAEQATRGRWSKIILTEMHAVRTERERNVGAVVDDEPCAMRACDAQRRFGRRIELARAGVLRAQLYERCAARAQTRDLLGVH